MNKKNILIIIVVIIILGFAGFYLTKDDTDNGSLVVDSKVKNSDDAQFIFNLINKMAAVRLDNTIFFDQDFQDLKDNSIEIEAQETNRDNPFAPVDSNIVGGVKPNTQN